MFKIVLFGASGSGKEKLVTELEKKLKIRISPSPQNIIGELAVGEFADYRTEMMLATERILARQWIYNSLILEGVDSVFKHSLLDNMLYAATKFHEISSFESTQAEDFMNWYLTTQMIGTFYRDSFKFDLIFVVEGSDEDEYNQKIADRIPVLLEELDLPYETLVESDDFLTKAQKIVTIVEKHREDNGSGDNNNKSDGETGRRDLQSSAE